jgi:hypothetical protein
MAGSAWMKRVTSSRTTDPPTRSGQLFHPNSHIDVATITVDYYTERFLLCQSRELRPKLLASWNPGTGGQ